MSKALKPFKFASLQELKDHHVRQFSKTSTQPCPKWNYISSGLNFRGICRSKAGECEAAQQYVWVPMGYSTFHLPEIIWNIPCPVCKRNLKKVQSLTILRGHFHGKGLKAADGDLTDDENDEGEPREVAFSHTINEKDKYLFFGQVDKQIIQWHYLILHCEKVPEPNKRASSLASRETKQLDNKIKALISKKILA